MLSVAIQYNKTVATLCLLAITLAPGANAEQPNVEAGKKTVSAGMEVSAKRRPAAKRFGCRWFERRAW